MKALTTLLTALGLIVSAAGGAALCGECDGLASPEAIAVGESCACSEACPHSTDAPGEVSIDARPDHNSCRSGLYTPAAAIQPDSRSTKQVAPWSGSCIALSTCETEDPQIMRAAPRSLICLSRGTPTPAFLSTTFLLL
jgi:hypothetical protein